MGVEYAAIEPYEICSIRPPTENASLTFRLTRNCPWNRCRFCPVYKFGASFSRREIAEVRADIRRAQRIDDMLFDEGFIGLRGASGWDRVPALVRKIRQAQSDALGMTGMLPERAMPSAAPSAPDAVDDPRIEWFMSWFREAPDLADSISHVYAWRAGGGETCFLGDADSLILPPAYLAEAMEAARAAFPTLRRFTVYGRTKSAVKKRSMKELAAYARAGLHRVHFGLESGCDEVLALMDKGVTGEEHVAGCLKTKEAGLSCSVYVMPGLGGAALSEKHAHDTAAVLAKIAPDFIRLRSLEVFPQTPLEALVREGRFVEASEERVVREIRTLVEEIDCATTILSDSASNLLSVGGRLPDDRAAMLEVIDSFLALDARDKLLFSLQARLESFHGQYGGITTDIVDELRPYLTDDGVDYSRASDDHLARVIRLIRGKLMP